MKYFLVVLLPLALVAQLISQVVFADVVYKTPQNTDQMIKFSVPYTFGVHDGTVSAVQGTVNTSDLDEVLDAHFQVAIENMATGNSTRDCHMREALGLDYTQSKFPKEHVCSGGTLPSSGPDSIQYATINVDFVKMSSSDPFVLNVSKNVALTLNITIHGVTKTYRNENVMITKTLSDNGLPAFRIETKLELLLKDFGVVVKPVKVGPVSIGVKDQVTIVINANVVGTEKN